LEKTRENLHKNFAKVYVCLWKQIFFPKQLIKKVQESGLQDALISGIRPPSDVLHFREAFGDKFFLVAIVVEMTASATNAPLNAAARATMSPSKNF
jgi:methylmalonyl-CoA mutase cobalamin-binding subunit